MSKVIVKPLAKFSKITGLAVCAASLHTVAINTVKAQEEVELSPTEKLEQKTDLLESAISKLQKLKITGYIQTQFQYSEPDADGTNFKLANRANAYELTELESYSRFGIRRGRIKFAYEDGILQAVFQPDITEKGVAFKDAYLSVKDPWIGTISVKAGIFDRPFGHEISYSSSTRESPERSRIFQTLFPDERDLGAMLTLQAAKESPWNVLKLEAGLFSGNGIRPQTESGFDFIGHLSASKSFDNFSISGGISAYIGGQLMYDGLDSVGNPKPVPLYEMSDNTWIIKEANNYGKSAMRQYLGADFQFSMYNSGIGFTALRAEYIFGTNPGASSSITLNPTALLTGARYLRDLSGGYVILTQDIPSTPFTVVAKYDWYDPNTNISDNDIKAASEIQMNTVGVGLIWYINTSLRLTGYYDIVSNETTNQLTNTVTNGKITKYGYEENRKDNVLTVRLQYKF